MTETTALLLYNFSAGEALQLKTMLGFLPDVQIIAVEKSGWHLTLDEVLAGKASPPLLLGRTGERKLLVAANASGQMLNLLLSAAAQVTGDQPVLRAVLTEHNRAWTGLALYDHLLEEEAELQRYIK